MKTNERKAYAPGTVTVVMAGDERITGVNRLAYTEPVRLPTRKGPHRWLWLGPCAPNHGPWHRDAKHVAWLLARWRDVVRERTRPRGTVHEEVLVTG